MVDYIRRGHWRAMTERFVFVMEGLKTRELEVVQKESVSVVNWME